MALDKRAWRPRKRAWRRAMLFCLRFNTTILRLLSCGLTQCSWKVPVLSVLLIKISNVWQKIKILSVRMSDTKIQDILHRTRTCLTENYTVWHDVSFCQTQCLTSLKSFQEVCWRHIFGSWKFLYYGLGLIKVHV